VAEDFDIGPLTWVKDEIDQALKNVLENLTAVSANLDDVATLRFSQTHLYQVSGALDMVGLVGCKRFCEEIEKLTGKLEKKAVTATPDALQKLEQAVNALNAYLQDLLNGSPDTPLRLFPALQALAEIQGETLEESELFFPDTSLRAPKDLPNKTLTEAEYPAYIAEQRALFQKSLLNWLKTSSPEGLNEMRAAIANVQQVQPAAQRTIWWVAGAFVDALSQSTIAEHPGVKRLCRRLDQQLRSNSEGAGRASANLLRDLLYYIALSVPTGEQIAQVKKLFELDHLLPGATDQMGNDGQIGAEEAQALEALKAAMDGLKDAWAAVSENQAGALEGFLQQLSDIIEPSQQLTNTAVANLFGTLHELATALDLDASKMGESALIEVAAGLTLLEDSLRDYGRPDAKTAQLLVTQTQRLQDVMGGGPMSDMSGAPISAQLDDSLLLAMSHQIRDALKLAEQALDTYFRNPGEQQVLQAATKPLQQVTAAFDMLDMLVPTAIARSCEALIEHFRSAASDVNQALFELVAESLSMLGFYVEELPRTRPESMAALEDALARLESQLQQLDISRSEDGAAPEAVADTVTTTELIEDQQSLTPGISTGIASEPAAASAETAKDSALDAELLDIYLTETEEVLGHVAENLQALRINATDNAALVEVRRGFHTLKGSGRTVGLNALGEVAWAVEKLLNLVLESKVVPSPAQLTFVEETSAAFAGWAAVLRETGEVELTPETWQRQAVLLENEAAGKPAAVAEEVLIDGTRKLSRTLLNIFLAEAAQHLQALRAGQDEIGKGGQSKPSDNMRRAAHTLASNAGAAGFKPIADLVRALEYWLDAHQGHWAEQSLSLLGNVVETLADMLEKAGSLRQPKPASGLVASLQDATIQEASAAESGSTAADMASDMGAVSEPTLQERLEELPPIEPTMSPVETTLSANEVQPVAAQKAAESTPATKPKKEKPAPAVDLELLTMFIEEARELVPQVGNELRAWRANPQESDHPDALQRALHTLKGSARMAGQAALGDTVHSMEDRVMRALKNKVSSTDFDDLFAGLDHIGGLLEEAVGSTADTRPQADADVPAVAAPSRSSDRRAQYMRVRADVLDRLINEAGEISIARARMAREMLNFKQFSLDLTESVFRLRNHLREMEIETESQLQSRMTQLEETHEAFDPLEFDRFTRLQELTRMMAESVNDVATIQHGLLMNLDETESALQQQNRMNRELQHGLMDVRMVPFTLISERLQRIVRQTARELGKRVEMAIDGESVELDRSVLDKIGAPLEHLLRNAVAHGMEKAAARKKAGKTETGRITLKVRQESDEIVLTVTDDGAGINLERVRAKAIEKGFFSADQEFSEQALLSVIFEPGFSTAADVTQISGRGVGLDAVRSDITALGGRIDVSNLAGQGAVFSIYLPVTLSVAQVVMIRAGTHVFALPSVMVEQVQKLKPDVLAQGYENQSISWSGRQYPLHFLGKLIGESEHASEQQRYTPLLLLRSGTFHIALHVDEILGNQEVVMKPIGVQLSRVPGMVGATVMGDGSIILIINPVQLANREMLSVGSVKVETVAAVEVNDAPVVMVVDDSLTMRKVLGRLLEREGYQVVTAKDGMDALQKLQETLPDIMLTDIEMPRMDGFELARNVRDDSRTAKIPLIIISSRTAEKHRKLAQEIGVNAFMGKPVQDEELIAQITALLEQPAAVSPA
jgi:chemosensory pili system protein ChpA (sensor histidine kinase/response regulator)